MVRNNFVFIKNTKFKSLNTLFFDDLDNNFIFFKKFNKKFSVDTNFVNIKKINVYNKCVNIIYF